jgi:hypothetical protein
MTAAEYSTLFYLYFFYPDCFSNAKYQLAVGSHQTSDKNLDKEQLRSGFIAAGDGQSIGFSNVSVEDTEIRWPGNPETRE